MNLYVYRTFGHLNLFSGGHMNKCCRLRKSRDNWKQKAVDRAELIREMRKKINRMSSKIISLEATLKKRITGLSIENGNLQAICKTRNDGNIICLQEAAFIRALCVILTTSAILSFRAVSRILSLLSNLGVISFNWTPHFTSIINWTLRAGMANLWNVTPCIDPWVAILDCSIGIGTRKALVVLRVSLIALQKKGGAIGLDDCECIGIEIAHSWNGSSVETSLNKIFEKAGKPLAILKDKGSDLKKGVVLWRQNQDAGEVWVIDDIGHETANALKAEYAKTTAFKKFIEIIHKGAGQLRQTSLAFVIPPKIRTKGRFQGITKVAKWASETLKFIGGQGRAKTNSDIGQIRQAFSGLTKLSPFLKKFISTCTIVSEFQKLLKNKGLNQATYREGKQIIETLPKRSKVRKRLENWLDRVLSIQCRLGIGQTPLIVSSDVIESLFGKFKIIIQRNPMAELNRLIYVIPLLCGNHTLSDIERDIKQVSHYELQKTLQNEIPTTLRVARQQYRMGVPKSGNIPMLKTG